MRAAPTIGLITAISEEFAAVKALVDNQKRLPVSQDRSAYVAGTMPSLIPGEPHHLVVTIMARAGNDIAAAACTNLLRSFPSVSVIVMCGIAAGIPRPADPGKHVELGDIVVATWGVIDYDHVDVTDQGVVLRAGFPRPSPLLASSANLLKAGEEEENRPWERWLEPSVCGLPKTYERPVLNGSGRPQHRRDTPYVHYGLIGSADRSLRSARVRDALAAKHNLRALEMEGKGIGNSAFLNGLEWFVVRGISDHGDSATADTWRRPASLAAAGYVRELLGECAPLDARGGHSRGTPGAAGKPAEAPQQSATLQSGIINTGPSIHLGNNYFGTTGGEDRP